jgi:5-hydroxyisourate hydrolase-like protein (transthyretin family)
MNYTEKESPQSIITTITITDADNVNMDSASVVISDNYKVDEDVLSFADQNGITGNWDAMTGTMKLTGSSTKANYETALKNVKYSNTSNNPDIATRTVSFVVNDGELNSNTGTGMITVTSVDDPPVVSFHFSPFTINEDQALTLKLKDVYAFISDPDNSFSQLNIKYSDAGNNLTFKETNDSSLIITPKSDWFGLDTIKVTVSDGNKSTSGSIALNVLSVNDLPVFSNLPDTLRISGNETVTLNLADIVSDVETPVNQLTFEFTSMSDSLMYNFNAQNEMLSLTANTKYNGVTTLQIKVTDKDGGVTETSVKVRVENTLTGIESLAAQIPNDYELYQNYPNPFNPSTNIRFQIKEPNFITLKIFNILGKEIATLVNEKKSPGTYEVKFNAGNLPSGIYFYKLSAGDFTDTRRLLLLK